MKSAYIIHCWGGSPKDNWYPWLKKKLEKEGFKVKVPNMPNTDEPKIEEWVPFLKKLIKNPNKDTYLIGHSVGCQTIMRYLESLKENEKVGGVLFVAGWFTLKGLESKESEDIARPWVETEIDIKKVKSNANKFVAIFSDDDPFVPIENEKMFKTKLDAKTIILKKQDHFVGKELGEGFDEIF